MVLYQVNPPFQYQHALWQTPISAENCHSHGSLSRQLAPPPLTDSPIKQFHIIKDGDDPIFLILDRGPNGSLDTIRSSFTFKLGALMVWLCLGERSFISQPWLHLYDHLDLLTHLIRFKKFTNDTVNYTLFLVILFLLLLVVNNKMHWLGFSCFWCIPRLKMLSCCCWPADPRSELF